LYNSTPYLISTPFFKAILKTTPKKLQIETSNDAHLLKPWPCSSWVGLGLLGLGPYLLKRIIRRTLDVLTLVHSSY